MKKIKILNCIETISSGGVEVMRLGFARHYNKDRFDLRIVCTNAKGPIKLALENEGIQLYQVGSFKTPFEIGKYRKVLTIIKEFSPDIIHGAVFEGMCMASICGFLGKVPVIILEETSDPQKRSLKAIWLQRQLAKLADLVIGISPSVTQYLIKKARIPANKVYLLNNAVDNQNFISKGENFKREDIGLNGSDYILGSVGRVHDHVKKYSDIIKAIKILNYSHIKFLLIGDGPDLVYLKGLALELGIEKQFISLGFKEDTATYYKIMDCFCIPSAQEGFGLVAVEAMFHQLPVIATEVGGLKDVVQNEQTGILVPPSDPQSIANGINYLINNPESSLKMGEEGYLRASKMYGISTYTSSLEKLYDSLLTKNR
ncbi:glycosyltransferase [Cyclobacterium sp. 1_MG-2023]|uniref:glycosyltransferase n=1 Tax=Cyclobacterium sp. 1_MG-2023 TaxID=3062681 RepID=UPI0026E2E0A3|nr:glycosyltransferase [Cyclobacterium sp. 1_MG-2023]MDO6439166.1 glycosyltransferase [Cyclobacterium sp. 1_MG-2023]